MSGFRSARKKSRQRAEHQPNRWKTVCNTKQRFVIAKNPSVRSSKHNPPVEWWQCDSCGSPMYSNRLSYDIYDMEKMRARYSVCNNQKCINLLIFREM